MAETGQYSVNTMIFFGILSWLIKKLKKLRLSGQRTSLVALQLGMIIEFMYKNLTIPIWCPDFRGRLKFWKKNEKRSFENTKRAKYRKIEPK